MMKISKAMTNQIKIIFRSYGHLRKMRGRLNNRGFTWVELIVVMVVMGIISAVVASGFMTDDTDLVAQTDTIKGHLRYAQLRSINTDTVWYLQFAAGSYELYKNGDATPKLLPGGDSPTITLPGGMNINYGASDVVAFNSWGKPCTDSAGQVLQTPDRTLTITSGSASRLIVITENTGFIQ
jgi:MSHA pilin protein MshC